MTREQNVLDFISKNQVQLTNFAGPEFIGDIVKIAKELRFLKTLRNDSQITDVECKDVKS
jgi:hypothetical protein